MFEMTWINELELLHWSNEIMTPALIVRMAAVLKGLSENDILRRLFEGS
jgi:hypothetical protein